MSGAQFIRGQEYDAVTAALREPSGGIRWLNGTDPAFMWGKPLNLPDDRGFVAVPGTVAALDTGRLAAVLERQGKALRVYETDRLCEIMETFIRDFKQGALYPEQKRLVLREYPPEAAEALKMAGYMQEMKDYVVYR